MNASINSGVTFFPSSFIKSIFPLCVSGEILNAWISDGYRLAKSISVTLSNILSEIPIIVSIPTLSIKLGSPTTCLHVDSLFLHSSLMNFPDL